jgi:hypothetical protein
MSRMLTAFGLRSSVLDRARARCCVRFVAVVVLAAAVVMSTGCGGGFCTAIGCAGAGVVVRLPALQVPATGDEATVETCVAGRCSETSQSAAALSAGATVTTPMLTEADVSFGRATVTVVVTGPADDRVIYDNRARARVTSFRPNGRGCPPVCVSADDVRFDE